MVNVELLDKMAFRATTDTGHEVVMDAAADAGGTDRGARPMELLLVGLGGCTGMDVISILRKMRQEVTAYQIRVSAERAPEHPKVFTTIHVEHIVHGHGLNSASVKHAVELSATRYCSVLFMLGRVAQISESYTLIEAEASATRQ
jgi:putative redox protein